MTNTGNRASDRPDLATTVALCEQLTRYLSLLGIRTKLQARDFGGQWAVSVAPLWAVDAAKLANALSTVSELRPYVDAKPHPTPPQEGSTP